VRERAGLLGTDIRLCTPEARFALPEVQRGLVRLAGTLARLPRQLPHCVAMAPLLTAEAIDATQRRCARGAARLRREACAGVLRFLSRCARA